MTDATPDRMRALPVPPVRRPAVPVTREQLAEQILCAGYGDDMARIDGGFRALPKDVRKMGLRLADFVAELTTAAEARATPPIGGLSPSETVRRWQVQIVENTRLAAENARLRAALERARQFTENLVNPSSRVPWGRHVLLDEIDAALGEESEKDQEMRDE